MDNTKQNQTNLNKWAKAGKFVGDLAKVVGPALGAIAIAIITGKKRA